MGKRARRRVEGLIDALQVHRVEGYFQDRVREVMAFDGYCRCGRPFRNDLDQTNHVADVVVGVVSE